MPVPQILKVVRLGVVLRLTGSGYEVGQRFEPIGPVTLKPGHRIGKRRLFLNESFLVTREVLLCDGAVDEHVKEAVQAVGRAGEVRPVPRQQFGLPRGVGEFPRFNLGKHRIGPVIANRGKPDAGA
ncbi:hypothetical protein [Kiritimatiella glycovorans]|uniref:hypothetical protein n=1 Tax=Kiritimatiella glycovorans TaxID=1307763 RepID=UPI00069C9A2C|nr:hypothetical protein [Kiritimatiella glycovorans]